MVLLVSFTKEAVLFYFWTASISSDFQWSLRFLG